MTKWVTQIKAVDPATGNICIWSGPHVPGRTYCEAVRYCQNNGLGYCEVLGRLVECGEWLDLTSDLAFDLMDPAKLN